MHTETTLVLALPGISVIHHQTKMQSTKHKSCTVYFKRSAVKSACSTQTNIFACVSLHTESGLPKLYKILECLKEWTQNHGSETHIAGASGNGEKFSGSGIKKTPESWTFWATIIQDYNPWMSIIQDGSAIGCSGRSGSQKLCFYVF